MCLFAARFAEPVFIEILHDDRILMRLSDRQISVLFVERLTSELRDIDPVSDSRRLDRLTAAVYAAAGACHDFHEVIFRFARLDLVKKSGSVSEAVGNGQLDFQISDLDRSLLDSLQASDIMIFDILQILTCKDIGHRSQSRLHNAAGSAEDNACTGSRSERTFKFALALRKFDARLADHPRQLTGRQDIVHILISLIAEFRSRRLEFLRYARHDGYRHDLRRIDVVSLRVVRFQHGAEHLVRRLAGGEIVEKFRIVVLAVLDPARAAGRDQRQLAAVLQSVQQLRALFENRQVRRRIRIEYLVKAQAQHRAYHLLRRSRSDRHAELFTDGRSDRRSRLNQDDFVRICDSFPYLVDGALFRNRAYRTGDEALTAVYAGNFADAQTEGRSDRRIESSVDRIDDADLLHISAGSHTASAGDTLLRISDQGQRSAVDRKIAFLAFKTQIRNIEFLCQSLQFTVLTSHTGETFSLVIGEQKLKIDPSRFFNGRRSRINLISLRYRIDTGRLKRFCALNLHQAHSAGADFVNTFQITERRDIYTDLLCSFQDGSAFRHLYGFSVDCNVYHAHSFFVLLSFFVNRLERALFHACAALQALRLIDFVRNLLLAPDCRSRAQLRTDPAALTDIRIDLNLDQLLTYARRTFLIYNVCDIFVSVVSQRAEDRIRRRLAESAESGSLDILCQSLETVDIFQFASSLRNLCQNLQHSLRTDSARRTLSAGFIHGEFQEEFCDVDHTVIFVHDDQSAGAHHGTESGKVIVCHRRIDMRCRNTAAGRAARLSRLEFLAAGNTSADIIDNFTQRGTHFDFHQTCIDDLSAYGEYLRSL